MEIDAIDCVLTWLAGLMSASLLPAPVVWQANRGGIGGFRAQAGNVQAPEFF